jgi:hypothetical protein
MTGWPTDARLENDVVVIGPVNDTIPFSLTYKLLTGPLPKSIGKPKGIGPVEALFSSVNGQDSGPLEAGVVLVAAVHAVPVPTVSVPKSSPSPPGPKTGPKSTLTRRAEAGAQAKAAQRDIITTAMKCARMVHPLIFSDALICAAFCALYVGSQKDANEIVL